MKKTTILMAALVMLLVGAPQAKAVPMYYTFEGDVTGWVDDAGAIDTQMGAGFGIGSAVSYTIIMDFDALGTQITNGNTLTTWYDGSADFFYADAYSGDFLSEVDGGSYNAGTDVAEYNYGFSYVGLYKLYVNSEDEKMTITSPVNWPIVAVNDTGFTGYNKAYNSNGQYSYIQSALTLTSIVPEPSILLLLGSGLLGLGMFRRVRGEG